MQTLKQVLDAGNDAEADAIIMSGGNVDMGNPTPTTGGNIFCRNGFIYLNDDVYINTDGGTKMRLAATEIQCLGAYFDMNDGSGSGGRQFNLDAAAFELGGVPGSMPSNPGTPVAYWPVTIEGTTYWVNLYQ